MAKQIIDLGDDVEHVYPGQYRRRRWLGRLAVVCSLAIVAAGVAAWWADRLARELGATQRALAGHLVAAATCGGERDRLAVDRDVLTADVTECRAEVARIGGVQREDSAALSALRANQPASAEEIEALRRQRAEGAAMLAALKDLEERLSQMIDAGKLRVRTRRGNLVVALPSEGLFGPGPAQLSRAGELALMELAVVLKKMPADRRFLVVGHTDDQPAPLPFNDDWQLTAAQGVAVTGFLVTAGMRPGTVTAGGAGAHEPETSNKKVDGRKRNRRVEVLISADFAGPPLPAAPAPTHATTPAPAPR